jgi:hypothetical protein
MVTEAVKKYIYKQAEQTEIADKKDENCMFSIKETQWLTRRMMW